MPTSDAHALEAVLTAKLTIDFRTAEVEFPGTVLCRIGRRVVATRLPATVESTPYDKARGLGEQDLDRVADVVAFYREAGRRPSIEVMEQADVPELRGALLTEGLAPTTVTVVLHAPARADTDDAPTGVQVHEVAMSDPRYLDVLEQGYELPSPARGLRRMLAIEHATPGLRRYLATVDGRPAGAAALFTHEGSAILVGAATVGAARHRGAQSALIRRRLADATHDSTTVVATTAEHSLSRTNLQRLGFATSHRRTLWQ